MTLAGADLFNERAVKLPCGRVGGVPSRGPALQR